MALNSIGMLENAPGAHRLESAEACKSMAKAEFEAAHINGKLYRTTHLMQRASLIGLSSAGNLQTIGSKLPVDLEMRRFRDEVRDMEVKKKNYAVSSQNHFSKATNAKKNARRDRIIGTIQKCIGRFFRVKSAVRYPILNR